jgi:hypothetical protein
MKISKYILIVALAFLTSSTTNGQVNMYWVGGSGDWTDLNHWVKTSGGSNITGSIPSASDNAFIDQNSGLNSSSTITIPPGIYSVNDLIISNSWDFELLFDGTSTVNDVEMNIHGDIDFHQNMNLNYSSNNISHNKWKFVGANSHDIYTGYNDLLNVEFFSEGGSYDLLNHFTASLQIRMYGGTWNSNGRDITSDKIYFKDDEPSNAPLTKVFNAGNSDIMCDEWDSKLTYGSLVVTGSYIIKTQKFTGSPKQNTTAFNYNEIHLLEYTDTPSGGSIIEHNNFECRSCIIQTIVVEDTGKTTFADRFTLNGNLTIENIGSSILFNGGNGRTSEVTFNGNIITPEVQECSDSRTLFSAVYTDFSVFIRNAGTLEIEDSILKDINTQGNASFELSNGVLQGSCPGWTLINNPTPISYYWKGNAGVFENWNDPNGWILQSGNSNGCIPSIVDDVYIDNNAKGDIRIPSPFNAECRNLIWTNGSGYELKLDGANNSESALTIAGDFELDPSAVITTVLNHEIYFSSANSNSILTNGVQLPEIRFIGELGVWNLSDDLNADRIIFEGGTLNTQNNDIETDYWSSSEEFPKQYNFGSSHIKVNGEMVLSLNSNSNVSVSPGTSLIECEELTSTIETLYDVQLNNGSSSLTMGNYNYTFHDFILNGSGDVKVVNDMTLENLIFNADNSTLILNLNQPMGSSSYEHFIINGGIDSDATIGSPAQLKSANQGTRVFIEKPIGNLCMLGYIDIEDLGTIMDGATNAPKATDLGNNSDINFDNGDSSTKLFWIGNSGDWEVKSNWSRVSGGCPATKNPNDMATLIFDNYSFTSSNEIVSVSDTNNANDIEFVNSNYDANIAITVLLSFDNIKVDGGRSKFSGKNLIVNEEVIVDNGGYLTSDLYSIFNTPKLQLESGIYILKADSKLSIID